MIFSDLPSVMAYGIAFILVVGAYLLCLAAIPQQWPLMNRVLAPTLFEPWSDQLEMFRALPTLAPAQRPARVVVITSPGGDERTAAMFTEVRQHHRPTLQADSVYAAIIALRKANYRVEPRRLEHHAIDGEQVDWRELVRRAKTLPTVKL